MKRLFLGKTANKSEDEEKVEEKLDETNVCEKDRFDEDLVRSEARNGQDIQDNVQESVVPLKDDNFMYDGGVNNGVY